ncbi:hypothetical protein GCM10009550_20310 [Actinocorallia libanotica]|uniref:Uncharacterized protein n=2 Tax=Actinocorallia libanotica TaxID=46162 RepID=A0ABP4B4M7_9ACTN
MSGPRWRVRIVLDEDARNPNHEYDQLAHVVTTDDDRGRYLPISDETGPLGWVWDRVKDSAHSGEVFERYARMFHGAVCVEDTQCPGSSGIWYVTGEKIARDDLTHGEVVEDIESQIEVYRKWAAGEVYECVVEKLTTWVAVDPDVEPSTKLDWVEVERVGNLYGIETAEEAARSELDHYARSGVAA